MQVRGLVVLLLAKTIEEKNGGLEANELYSRWEQYVFLMFLEAKFSCHNNFQFKVFMPKSLDSISQICCLSNWSTSLILSHECATLKN